MILTTTVIPKHSSSNHDTCMVLMLSQIWMWGLKSQLAAQKQYGSIYIYIYMKCRSIVLNLASTLFTSGATQMISVLSNNIHTLHQYSDE